MFNYTLYFLDDANKIVAQEYDQFSTDFPAIIHAENRLSASLHRTVEVWWAGACIYRQRKSAAAALN